MNTRKGGGVTGVGVNMYIIGDQRWTSLKWLSVVSSSCVIWEVESMIILVSIEHGGISRCVMCPVFGDC